MASAEPTSAASNLCARLRDLREHAPSRLTQTDMGHLVGDDDKPVSTSTISTWENPGSGRLVPRTRLDAYARLFCTVRSFEGGPHLLTDAELTTEERRRLGELREELVGLRDLAAGRQGASAAGQARSMWHFPDGARITLVCSRLPPDRRARSADPDSLNYMRLPGLADVDSLFDIYGAVMAHNPASRVEIKAAQDLNNDNDAEAITSHLVLIGGIIWNTTAEWFSDTFQLPVMAEDPGARGAIVVQNPGGKLETFSYKLAENASRKARELIEDVGFFARGVNPHAPERTLTICGGITTRGVRGAAQCFIDQKLRQKNERYVEHLFSNHTTYCIGMRVRVVNNNPVTPDLSEEGTVRFVWPNADMEADDEDSVERRR